MIRVLYFASLRDRLGRADETLSERPATVAELRAALVARGGIWGDVFADGQRVLAAVNQEMASAEQVLNEGDEVGFFPPVTGG
ncbi:MAG: molybdopterin converting factor subunit 1 [Chromatiaceae bacterium]|jgi:molybdopterin synthase sulfur carrier subunit|nr:molybdopterin converting factor subunit 1 [Chromatiaceae bacterium]